MSSNQNRSQEPGLIASHAEYIKGAAVVRPTIHPSPSSHILTIDQEAVGTVTGSQEWKHSGEQQKQHAIDDMKHASEHRDPNKDGFGKSEEIAGRLTGCEGMKKEGVESQHARRQ